MLSVATQPVLSWEQSGYDYFISLLGDIRDACNAKSTEDVDEIPLVIDSITELFLDHFDSEELLMSQSNYPDLKRHKAQHLEMAFHIRTQGEKIAKERSFPMLIDFCTFFIDWLLHHEQVADAKFYSYIKPGADGNTQTSMSTSISAANRV